MTDETETGELTEAQRRREAIERAAARAAPDESETAQHERRAEKARYLREKLEERAESEREAQAEAEREARAERRAQSEPDESRP